MYCQLHYHLLYIEASILHLPYLGSNLYHIFQVVSSPNLHPLTISFQVLFSLCTRHIMTIRIHSTLVIVNQFTNMDFFCCFEAILGMDTKNLIFLDWFIFIGFQKTCGIATLDAFHSLEVHFLASKTTIKQLSTYYPQMNGHGKPINQIIEQYPFYGKLSKI